MGNNRLFSGGDIGYIQCLIIYVMLSREKETTTPSIESIKNDLRLEWEKYTDDERKKFSIVLYLPAFKVKILRNHYRVTDNEKMSFRGIEIMEW